MSPTLSSSFALASSSFQLHIFILSHNAPWDACVTGSYYSYSCIHSFSAYNYLGNQYSIYILQVHILNTCTWCYKASACLHLCRITCSLHYIISLTSAMLSYRDSWAVQESQPTAIALQRDLLISACSTCPGQSIHHFLWRECFLYFPQINLGCAANKVGLHQGWTAVKF